jgi:Cu-processing system permease protein
MGSKLVRIAAVARLVVLDGLRRHALLGLVVLAVAAQLGAFFFFDFIPRDIGRASADFILSIAWLAGFIFLFFHGVQVMAMDEEKKVVYALLARPISRGEYVLGIFAGLALLLLLLNLLLGSLGFGSLLLIKQMVSPIYFSHLNAAAYLLAWLGLYALQLLLLAVILLFSGLVRGSFPVLLVSLAYYAICSGLPVVREAVAQATAAGSGPAGLDRLLQGLTALFPDFARLDYKNLITAGGPGPELASLAVNFGLAGAYIVLALWLAAWVYQRRDLQ